MRVSQMNQPEQHACTPCTVESYLTHHDEPHRFNALQSILPCMKVFDVVSLLISLEDNPQTLKRILTEEGGLLCNAPVFCRCALTLEGVV